MIWQLMSIAIACTAVDVTHAGNIERACTLAGETANAAEPVGQAYDMLNPKGRRRSPSAVTMAEDRHLPDGLRRKMIGGMRTLRRNSSILDWMVAQHLNYCVSATFQSTTGDKVFDKEAEAIMKAECRAENIDFRGMLDLEMQMRLCESHAVLDGDVGLMFLDAGTGQLQGIEGDRIRNPVGASAAGVNPDPFVPGDWYNGVHVVNGVPDRYALHRRLSGWSAFEFERYVSPESMALHGYIHRFDQYRGVSPVASAYNQLQDVYEAESYSLLKTKIAGLFALKIKYGANGGEPYGEQSVETDENGNPIPHTYKVDFGAGPTQLNLRNGDDADFLSNRDPGSDVQNFWRFVTAVAMKSLDLPYALFDESQGNFFGNKTAWLGYDRSCETKRARCCGLRDRITAFKYRKLIQQRLLTLPRVNGRRLTVADRPWAWVPRKMPWWRPLEEVTAEITAIGAGLSNPYHACMESDQGDFETNIDLIAKAMAYAKEAGVPLSFVIGEQIATAAADSAKARKEAGKAKAA